MYCSYSDGSTLWGHVFYVKYANALIVNICARLHIMMIQLRNHNDALCILPRLHDWWWLMMIWPYIMAPAMQQPQLYRCEPTNITYICHNYCARTHHTYVFNIFNANNMHSYLWSSAYSRQLWACTLARCVLLHFNSTFQTTRNSEQALTRVFCSVNGKPVPPVIGESV